MKTIVTTFLIVLTGNLFGITINGKVNCAKSNVPVPNALLIMSSSFGGLDSLYADSLGTFILKLSQKGSYKITAHSNLVRSQELGGGPLYYKSKPAIINYSNPYTVPRTIQIEMESVRIPDCAFTRINFVLNTDSIIQSNSLQNVFQILNENKISEFEIMGFCSTGEDSLLRNLRANKVMSGLIKLGLEESSMTINNNLPNSPVTYQTFSCDGSPLVEPKESLKNARVEIKVTVIQKN